MRAAVRLSALYPQVPASRICHSLDVPRSSYYRPRKAKVWDRSLIDAIEKIVQTFLGYGYRRVAIELQRQGFEVGRKKVLRAMKEHSLLCHLKRRWVKTTDSEHGLRRYPNLAKGMATTGLNQLWVADLTYIRTQSGFVYLAAILDAHSRKAIAWHVSKSLSSELALCALGKAIANRNPPAGWIHHSDQGVQYACRGYVDLVARSGGLVSMSGRGKPRDNAKAESFFATLKREEVRFQHYLNIRDVEESMENFIDEIYNPKRMHSGLNYQAPDEYESQAKAESLAT